MRSLCTLCTLSALGALAALTVLAARPALAQVDVEPPRPNVLLLVDSSGSMEYKADGTQVTVCDPNPATTSDMNRWTTLVTVLTGTINGRGCYSLSRTSNDFVNEYGIGGVQPYDYGYMVGTPIGNPYYHRIVSNGCVAGPGTMPTQIYDWPVGAIRYHNYNNTTACNGWSQERDGLLDVFQDRVRFGLMTFDTREHEGTGIVNGAVNVPNGFAGLWSYYQGWRDGSGSPVQGRRVNCVLTNFEVGARNEAAPPWEGRLISMGKPNATLSEPGGIRDINGHIQEALIALRPYYNTPLAGMFEDAYTFFRTDVSRDPLDNSQPFAPAGDPYFGGATHGCRKTYMIVLSDGEPNNDLRPWCETGNGICPYRQPYAVAHDLANPADPTKAVLTFAVGFGLSSISNFDCNTLPVPGAFASGGACDGVASGSPRYACCTLQRIAYEGGTQHAYFADDMTSLRSALSSVLAQISATSTSRTLPSFASGSSSAGSIIEGTAPAKAYEFVSSFEPMTADNLWQGNLERKRWVCADDGTGLAAKLVTVDKTKGDDFSANVNEGKALRPRQFMTVVGTSSGGVIQSGRTIRPHVTGTADGIGTYSGATTSGSNSDIASAMRDHPEAMAMSPRPAQCSDVDLNAATAGDCAYRVMNWALGGSNGGTLPSRSGHEFGAIYHSTPFTYGQPDDYLRDESYAVFAAATALRPLMLYTATTDGQLHAFKVAPNDPNDNTGVLGDRLKNNELWSFIPPYVLPHLLASYPRTQQVLLDGAPVVQDIVFERTEDEAVVGGGTGRAAWHTVLLAGGGSAGGFYYALDVTDPTAPSFLWQLSSDANGAPLFGASAATPGLATIAYNDPEHANALKEIAVAILPGGDGSADPNPACQQQRQSINFDHIKVGYQPRQNLRCWLAGPGRSLTIVRLSDGKVLKTFRGNLAGDGPASLVAGVKKEVAFDAPITGTPVPYPSRPGEVADRIYVGDEDGTLWRVNLANPDSTTWDVNIMFDAYSLSTDARTDGQPVAVPPVVAVDGVGNTIVLFATGDQQDFFTPAAAMKTRLWSLKEKPVVTTTNGAPFHVEANWLIPFTGGKRVTGPIALFDTVAYFSTFTPTGGSNACMDGYGSIWGVDYIQHTTEATGPYPVARLAEDPNAVPIHYIHEQAQDPGVVVFGVGVTQKPSCYLTTTVNDSYSGSHTQISASTKPVYQLVYQTGSGGQASEGAKTNTNSQVLPALAEMTRIDSWASIVE